MSSMRRRCGLLAAGLILAAAAGDPVAAQAGTDGSVLLRTVPATAGVRIAVGSATVVTGNDGTASLQVGNLNGVAQQVHVAGQQVGPSTTVTLSKIQTAPHTAPHQSSVSVGLNVISSVRLRISPGKTGYSPSFVRAVRLHSTTGQVIKVDPQKTGQLSLLSLRTALQHGVLTPQRVTWSVDRISAGPGVALTAATAHFDPASSSTWDVALQTMNGTVEIATVPATPGVVFLLEGASITTGNDGTAQAPIGDLNSVDRRLTLDTPTAGPLTVSVLRVTKRKPGAIGHRRLLVALSTHRSVSLRFTDLSGQTVAAQRINSVRLQGHGHSVIVAGVQVRTPVSLLAGVATQVNAVWQPRKITYAVSSVVLDGSDAVFAGKQRFDPMSSTWVIKLSVFDITVTAHDALFGNRIASHAVVTRPNGTRYPVLIGTGAPTVMDSMVRGFYDLSIDRAALGSRSTMLVSRDDVLDVHVITTLDVIVIAIVGLALTVAAVLSGRYIGRRRSRGHVSRGAR
jgi:hypothetical protein